MEKYELPNLQPFKLSQGGFLSPKRAAKLARNNAESPDSDRKKTPPLKYTENYKNEAYWRLPSNVR